MINTHCAICGKEENIISLYKENFTLENISARTFSARRRPDKIHYRFVKCLNCGLIFSNPILNEEDITSLYFKSNFYYSLESEYLKETYGYYLDKIINKERDKLSLLDVGCGNGFFMQKAQEMGIKDVFGIEPGKASVMKAPKSLQNRITNNVLKPNIFKRNSFNIITCFHTLDHIIDPNKFLKIIYSLLRTNGKVFLIVHNSDGISVKLFGEKSPIFDIEHIYLFNKSNLSKIFSKNGFQNIKVFNIKNKYPLSYFLKMTPLPKFIKNHLSDLLKISQVGKIPIKLNIGNIGIEASIS